MRYNWVLGMILTGLLAAGCGGLPSERAVYRVARETVQADPGLPQGAKLYPRGEVDLYVLKNAARVDFHYDYADEDGRTRTGTYIVWLKRVARRWELDRYSRAPELGP